MLCSSQDGSFEWVNKSKQDEAAFKRTNVPEPAREQPDTWASYVACKADEFR
jgi:hypothetical protein